MAAPFDNSPQEPNQPNDPFANWYRNTIQANPNRFDPAHFSEGQARNWYGLWDPSGRQGAGGFRSSKVDRMGNPIQGSDFDHPDECPPGMTAYGQNQCVPVGEIPGQGGGFGGGGYSFGGGGGHLGQGGPQYNFGDLPEFKPPNLTDDPGYQFRLKQGMGALEASAAAKGVLNTGGTLQGVQQFGQDLASQEYGNAWNRYKDMYAPKLAEWQMRGGAERDRAMADFARQWQAYQFAREHELAQQQMILNAQPPGMGY